MAAYPTYDTRDLSEFSGRPESEYEVNSQYAATAVSQAILLFKLGTCLKSWPDDPVYAELAKNAVLAMADAIFLAQSFQKVLANPFNSETIGSYSYSKAANAVSNGLPTGVGWFDMAVSQMGVCDLTDDIPVGGGIEVFDYDVPLVPGKNGNMRMLTPADIEASRRFGYDPSFR